MCSTPFNCSPIKCHQLGDAVISIPDHLDNEERKWGRRPASAMMRRHPAGWQECVYEMNCCWRLGQQNVSREGEIIEPIYSM